MRVVIVGATGNVGTSLIEALSADDQVTSILGLARRMPAWRPDKTTWAKADVARDDLHSHLEGADALVHLAWLFQPTHDPLITWQTNVKGSIRVLKAASDTNVPAVVFSSSVGAYSPGSKDKPVDESWPTHGLPTAAYGREKAYMERVLDSFEKQNPQTRVVRMRPAFIFKRQSAPHQRRLFLGPFVPGRLISKKYIPIVPDLDYFRFQALHASDAAEAYRLAILRDVSGPFNIAAEPALDPGKFAEILDAKVIKIPRQLLRAAAAVAWHLHLSPASPHLLDLAEKLPILDSSRARSELGWAPRHSSTYAIEEFLIGLQEATGMDTPPLHSDT